mmetsp:Transcript_30515/g.67054  ORF Transcript_30515/g.67054 Transcript_30515/m.67054 type:complete len:545 (-) Transcript_30515:852-2486(-)
MATTLQAPHGASGCSVYANLSREEFEGKISHVQAEIRELMNELPSCKKELDTRNLVELIDEEITRATSVLEENRRRVCVSGGFPGVIVDAAETRSIKMKITLKKLEQDVEKIKTFRAECLNEGSYACSVKQEEDETGLDITTVAPNDKDDAQISYLDQQAITSNTGSSSSCIPSEIIRLGPSVASSSDSNSNEAPRADDNSVDGELLSDEEGNKNEMVVSGNMTPASSETQTGITSLPEQDTHDKDVKIKQEIKCVNDVTRDKRQYGDRFLIGRHDPKGIMRLGGNGQSTNPKPREDHPRLQTEIGNLAVCCYSDIWQSHFAPQYAGSDGWVDWVPPSVRGGNVEFAVFMRRSMTKFSPDTKTQGLLLGWEYCGNYMWTPDEDIDEIAESALSFSVVSKKSVAKKILVSSKRGDGYGRRRLDYWRSRLQEETKRDKSPPGPKWMIERRSPSHEEKEIGQYPLAARARALGYKTGISDEKLAYLIVELNEYHTLYPISFVRYQEAIYDYVKGGKTGRTARGKKCSQGDGSAKASDWYSFLDTLSF